MRHGKPVRFDYGNVFSDGSDEIIPFCLTDKFRRFLLQVAYRGLWSRVWGVALTSEEKSVIENGIRALCEEDFCEENMPINVTVNPTITNTIESCGCGCDGGGGGQYPPPWQNTPMPGGTPTYPIPPVNPPINPNPIPPIAPPGTPQSEWDIYRCKLANYAFDQIRAWLVAVSEIPGTLVTIGAILMLIWTLAPAGLLAIIGVGVLELASVIWAWYGLSEGIDEIAEFAIEWWDDHRQEIVCKFYNMTDINVTRSDIVGQFLDDLATWAETRPWWVDSLANMLASVGGKLFPLQIFLAPWELVPPDNYVGTTDCTLCNQEADDGWGDHATYVWIPLTNALAREFSVTYGSPGQQNVGSHVLTDDGRIAFSYSDASSSEMRWEAVTDDVLSLDPTYVRVAGVAFDFYDQTPNGDPSYWHHKVNNSSTAEMNVGNTDVWPKKHYVTCSNNNDSDVTAAIDAIPDVVVGTIPLSGGGTITAVENIQSNSAHNMIGHARMRFLVKVEGVG